MMAFFYLAKILERDYDGLSAWGMAILFVLLPEPIRLFSKSFLLSFSAVLGIYLFAPLIYREFKRVLALTKKDSIQYRVIDSGINIIAYSIAANLLTAPFLLYFFIFLHGNKVIRVKREAGPPFSFLRWSR